MNRKFTSDKEVTAYYAEGFSGLRHTFERTGSGPGAIRRRSALVDTVVEELWRLHTGEAVYGVALVATGGFGRRELFPYSDIDVLYLCADTGIEAKYKETIRGCNQAMWDTGLRASAATRTLKECDRLYPDNPEFTLSLLDRRFLGGDQALFDTFAERMLPALFLREWSAVANALAEKSRTRHARYGDTIFHLEPNIKECPGGLRDYNVAHWLAMLRYLNEHKQWPSSSSDPCFATTHDDLAAAFQFLSATRCFLHLRADRDENALSWHAQDEAAGRSIGLETAGTADPAYWMRTYYRHARTVSRRVTLLLDAVPPAREPFLRALRKRRVVLPGVQSNAVLPGTGISPGTGVVLRDGRVDFEDTGVASDPEAVLGIFAGMAEHGYRLSQRAENAIADTLPVLDIHLPEGPFLWNALRGILLGSHAAKTLRTMHELGVLELLVPEFHGIDALVIRDAYHRYTVDEHTFLAIDSLHALRRSTVDWERPFASLVREIDRLDLTLLALLMHDTGKGRRTGDHTTVSVELTESLLHRLDLDSEEREIVCWLIRDHLEMSAALRRDIFDPEMVKSFADRVATPLRLKMLCLVTFADIRAVSPEALTPWKAETLWQLFISTSNYLDRNVDEQRYHADVDPAWLRRLVASVPGQEPSLRGFLEGLPQRYLQTRSPEEIRAHLAMASVLGEEPVQVALRERRQLFELTLITHDRPMLFGDVAGVLSGWGMNIVKADAFSNEAGVVVDSFGFADPFGTLALNPSERERFTRSVRDVVGQKVRIETLLGRRRHAGSKPAKVHVETRCEFDNAASSHSTVLQVVAQDGPGLLRAIALTLAGLGCDIKVALIDTEGEMAIDVFYVTLRREKLDDATQAELGERLRESIASLRPALASP